MRANYVPDRAVLAGVGTTVLWIGSVLLVHAAGATSMIEALNTIEDVSLWLLLGGIPGGVATGALADEYAPVMKQGFLASVGGAAVLVAAFGAYGVSMSIIWGYGADSLLSFMFTGPTAFTFFLLMPMLAMEGVVFALVASEVMFRWRRREAV